MLQCKLVYVETIDIIAIQNFNRIHHHFVNTNNLCVGLRLSSTCLTTCIAHNLHISHQFCLVFTRDSLRARWPHSIEHDLLKVHLNPLVELVIDLRNRNLSDACFLFWAHIACEMLLYLVHNSGWHAMHRGSFGRVNDNLKLMTNFRDA